MGLIDEITQMRNQGMDEQEIVDELRQRNISPREINDALSQSHIKNAVSNSEEMQQSVMGEEGSYVPKPTDAYTPQTQDIGGQQNFMQQQGYPQQDYYQGGYDEYSQDSSGSDIMIEVAEQVFATKIKKIDKQVDELAQMKTLMQTKLDNVEDRLARMEKIIDKLQIAILEKIGSYGQNLNSIKKEMSMMQNSFGKIVNRAVSHPIHKSTTHKTAKKKSKKK